MAGTTPATSPGRPQCAAATASIAGVGEQHWHAVGGPDHQHDVRLAGDDGVRHRARNRRSVVHHGDVGSVHLDEVTQLGARGEVAQEQPQVAGVHQVERVLG